MDISFRYRLEMIINILTKRNIFLIVSDDKKRIKEVDIFCDGFNLQDRINVANYIQIENLQEVNFNNELYELFNKNNIIGKCK